MEESVPPHNHCRVCGKAVAEGATTCSKACAAKRAATIRSNRMTYYVFIGLAVLLVVFFALSFK